MELGVCFVCHGIGCVTTEEIVGEWDHRSVEIKCSMCEGSGFIYPKDLYECQGMGCGVLVTGVTLMKLDRCQCNAPAKRFVYADRGDPNYPTTGDDYAEAVWTLEELNEIRNGKKEKDNG